MKEKEKLDMVAEIESMALYLNMKIENSSIDEKDKDYWFFYHMLCVTEQLITDVHQFEMLH